MAEQSVSMVWAQAIIAMPHLIDPQKAVFLSTWFGMQSPYDSCLDTAYLRSGSLPQLAIAGREHAYVVSAQTRALYIPSSFVKGSCFLACADGSLHVWVHRRSSTGGAVLPTASSHGRWAPGPCRDFLGDPGGHAGGTSCTLVANFG